MYDVSATQRLTHELERVGREGRAGGWEEDVEGGRESGRGRAGERKGRLREVMNILCSL